MRKLKYGVLISIVLLFISICYAQMTEVDDWKITNSEFTAMTVDYMKLTATDTAPSSPSEGWLYWNDTSNAPQWYNGSAWVVAGNSSAGDSLDTAYNNGNGITVDGSAVTLTVGAADNNSALIITHGETTNDNTAFLITNSADAANAISIDIDGQTTGRDIEGTGATWYVTGAGAVTAVGLTNSGALEQTTLDATFNGSNYDIEFDISRDQLHFEDSAVLAMGGADNAAGDVTFKWDGSNLLVESAAEDTGEIQIGATNAIDVVFYGNTNTTEAMFNANTATLELNGYALQIQDDDDLFFGDSDDFTIEYDEDDTDNLIIIAGTANDAVQIGTAAANTDTIMHGTTASTFAKFDASADELVMDLADLKISQGSQIEFIDVTDSLTDWTIDNATDETLLIYPTETTDDQSINLGNATNTTDLRLFGATASTVIFDASADNVLFNAYDIQLQDDDVLAFGDGKDVILSQSSANLLTIGQTAAGTGSVAFGINDAGLDVKFFGDTASAYSMWDTSANQFLVAGGGQISLNDSVELLFGTGTTNAGDFSITGTSAPALVIDVIAAGTGSIEIGNDADDVPLKWFGETASSYFQFTGDNFNSVASTVSVDVTSTLAIAGATTNTDTVVTTGTFAVTTAMSGKILVIPDLAGNTSITLPVEADGLNYEFWYVGAAADTHDHTIDSGNNANYFTGGVIFTDTDDSSVTAVYSNGSSNSKLTINNAGAGTFVKITCDGVDWYTTGSVVSDTVPEFADQ